MAMFAPSLASSTTMALPMPLLPPVTIATLFFKSITPLLVISTVDDGRLSSLALAFVPVDPSFIAAIQDLNGRRFAEIAPRPIDKGSDSCPEPIHQQCVYTYPCSK